MSESVAVSAGNTCVLTSIDMVIERVGEAVVPQNRVYELVVPYNPTCTLQNAESMRDAMECVRLLELVGSPST